MASAERFVARVRWMLPRTPAVDGLSPAWRLLGDDGHDYDSEAVLEAPSEARRRWWMVTTRRAEGVN